MSERIINAKIAKSTSAPGRAKKTFGKGCGSGRDFSLSGTMINGNIESYAVREPYITGFASTKCLDATVEAACEGSPPQAQQPLNIQTTTQPKQSDQSEKRSKEMKEMGWYRFEKGR